jgi:predicted lysophospholipase L1 biosynthesis ABC-type transport system permease subunit
VLEGRFPAAGDELALGPGTLAQLGKDIGDEVVFTALEGGETRLRIVGAVVAPAVLAFPMDLDSGGVMRYGDLAAALGPCCGGSPTSMLVLFRDGVDRDAALDRLRADFPGTVLGPMTPQDVRDLGRVRRLPYLLAGLLGVMALASVALMLATVARRRRRDLAVLRGIGFDRRQVRSLVVTQSAVFTGLALVAGVPLGVAAGRLAWRLAADGLGTEVGPLVPVARILLAAVALVLLVAAVARVVGSSVARLRPAAVLRAE